VRREKGDVPGNNTDASAATGELDTCDDRDHKRPEHHPAQSTSQMAARNIDPVQKTHERSFMLPDSHDSPFM